MATREPIFVAREGVGDDSGALDPIPWTPAKNMKGSTHGGARGRKGEEWRDTYATPQGVIEIVKQKVGIIHLDAAAVEETSKGISYIGPDHRDPAMRDALNVEWVKAARAEVGGTGFVADNQLHAFLNPPFGNIADFAYAAAFWGQRMTVTFLSYGRSETGWWQHFIHPHACETIVLTPRVRYVDPRTGQLRKGSPNIHSCLSIFRPGFTGPPRVSYANWTDFQPKNAATPSP